MKKYLTGFLFIFFSLQITAFADTAAPVTESKLKKAGIQTSNFAKKAARSALDYTYLLLRKVGVTG